MSLNTMEDDFSVGSKEREKKESKKRKKAKKEMRNVVTKSKDGKSIIIPFDKIFNQEIKPYVCEFSMSKKRNFVSTIDLYIEDLNHVISAVEKFVYSYAEIKYKIITKVNNEEDYPKKEFISDLMTIILKEDVREEISRMVESEYSINLDAVSKKSKKTNEELQITDRHNKAYLKSSIASRLLIPMIMEFNKYYPNVSLDTIIFDTSCKIFNSFESEDIIYNKLYKFIDSRIVGTVYSDSVIWKYYKSMSIDPNIVTRMFMRKVVVNIIPKIENNRNVISYLHVVLKNQLNFQFTSNNPINYKPLNLNAADSEGLTNFDRLESNMIRIDEGAVILNKLTVKSEIAKLMEKFDVKITKEEFAYYRDNIKQNKIQNILLFLFFSRYTGSFTINYYSNFNEYVLFVIIMKKWMKENDFMYLEKYITGIPTEKYVERKSITKKKFLDKLEKSKEYNTLLDTKYKFVKDLIDKSGIIHRVISTLASNKFHALPEYSEYLKNDSEQKEIDDNIENISIELIRFIKTI
jgi:hypothetical protein